MLNADGVLEQQTTARCLEEDCYNDRRSDFLTSPRLLEETERREKGLRAGGVGNARLGRDAGQTTAASDAGEWAACCPYSSHNWCGRDSTETLHGHAPRNAACCMSDENAQRNVIASADNVDVYSGQGQGNAASSKESPWKPSNGDGAQWDAVLRVPSVENARRKSASTSETQQNETTSVKNAQQVYNVCDQVHAEEFISRLRQLRNGLVSVRGECACWFPAVYHGEIDCR